MDPVAFQSDLENYRLLPASIVGPVAYYLPYLELLVGAGLISGLFYSGILLISGGFLAVFLSALTAAWVRGLDIHCGCFGKASAGGSVVGSIVLDICLAGIWGVLLFAHLGKQKDDNLS
jgi:hypothetical protein